LKKSNKKEKKMYEQLRKEIAEELSTNPTEYRMISEKDGITVYEEINAGEDTPESEFGFGDEYYADEVWCHLIKREKDADDTIWRWYLILNNLSERAFISRSFEKEGEEEVDEASVEVPYTFMR
jgi:hypothetical protein